MHECNVVQTKANSQSIASKNQRVAAIISFYLFFFSLFPMLFFSLVRSLFQFFLLESVFVRCAFHSHSRLHCVDWKVKQPNTTYKQLQPTIPSKAVESKIRQRVIFFNELHIFHSIHTTQCTNKNEKHIKEMNMKEPHTHTLQHPNESRRAKESAAQHLLEANVCASTMLLLAQCAVVVSTFFYFVWFWFLLLRISLNAVVAQRSTDCIYVRDCQCEYECDLLFLRFVLCTGMMSDLVEAIFESRTCTLLHTMAWKLYEKPLHRIDFSGRSVGLLVWWFWCFVFVSQLPLVVWTGWKHFQKMLSLLGIFYFQMYFCYPLAVLVKAKACNNLHKMIFDAFVRSCLRIYSAFVGIWSLVHCFHFQFSCQSKWRCLHSPIAHMHPYTKSIHENINTFYWTR